MGVDVARLLDATQLMVRSCGASVPPADNPGVALGIVLGARRQGGARQGDDHRLARRSPISAPGSSSSSRNRPASTGAASCRSMASRSARPSLWQRPRLRRSAARRRARPSARAARLEALERAGHPVLRFAVADVYAIGQEFFRWEIATAVAGAVIGIDPFDQPDVEASKVKTRELTAAYEKTGKLPRRAAALRGRRHQALRRCAQRRGARRRGARQDARRLARRPSRAHCGAGDYCAFLAYIERNERHIAALHDDARAGARREARRDLRRVRAALPAFDRPGLQGRAEQRRLPADHLR